MSRRNARPRPAVPAAASAPAAVVPSSPLVPCLLALTVFLCYVSVFKNTFLYGDDEELILRNAYLRDWHFLPALLSSQTRAGSGIPSNFFRPLQMLLYFLCVRLFGAVPWPIQLLNVSMHAAAAAFLYLILRKLAPLEERFAALLTLVWALHPIHVEAVANINGTADPLTLAALLASFWLFLNGSRILSLVCFAAGLASKESAIVFPALLLLHDGILAREKLTWRRHLPYWLTAAVYWGLRTAALRGSLTLDFYQQQNLFTEHLSYRIYTLFTVMAEGLRLLAWPSGLHAERSWPVFVSFWLPPVLGSAALLAALLGLAFYWRASRPLACFGLLWFFLSYAPMSNLFAKINALFWDHWFYVPSLGLVFVGADLAARSGAVARKAVALAGLLVLFFLGVRTWAQIGVWRDPLTFDEDLLRYEPDSAKTWNNYAMALSEKRPKDAIPAYQRAIALSDTYPQTRYNLGNCYRDIGDLNQAMREYRRALEIDPNFYFAHLALGDLLLRGGYKAQGIAELKEALRIYPELPDVRRYLESLQPSGR